ncbi:protein of unknown function (plasmid) [Cupriavidus taiwanensis]|uniref:Alpha/beta hydrolase fold-3 domain-containing protein n=1 Tax=Cupriavidus taiwanensis TaxID=164546 RepID=A0A375IPC9_9BURK|nr:protein of unknown function [Cupriavidus taiwanensis]
MLLWPPVTDANIETASYNEFAQGHFLTKNMMEWFWDNYTTDAQQRVQYYALPLRAHHRAEGPASCANSGRRESCVARRRGSIRPKAR